MLIYHSSMFTEGIVEIHVGKAGTKYIIYKHLLVNSSDYFRAAFTEGRFVEGGTRTLHLPEEDPTIFLVILEGIHQGLLSRIPKRWKSWKAFIKLHVALHRYGLTALKNSAMDLFIKLLEIGEDGLIKPTGEDLILAYENTVPSSPLRKLLLDVLACMFSASPIQVKH